MKEYDLPGATTAIQQLWLHDFANFYLELAKDIVRNGKPKAQAATRNVLYKVRQRRGQPLRSDTGPCSGPCFVALTPTLPAARLWRTACVCCRPLCRS